MEHICTCPVTLLQWRTDSVWQAAGFRLNMLPKLSLLPHSAGQKDPTCLASHLQEEVGGKKRTYYTTLCYNTVNATLVKAGTSSVFLNLLIHCFFLLFISHCYNILWLSNCNRFHSAHLCRERLDVSFIAMTHKYLTFMTPALNLSWRNAGIFSNIAAHLNVPHSCKRGYHFLGSCAWPETTARDYRFCMFFGFKHMDSNLVTVTKCDRWIRGVQFYC